MHSLGVSVVIPTLNRDGFLYDSINDMIKQDYPKFEIIVVDQSKNVNIEIEKLAKENSNLVRYYRNVGFKGLPQARNFGWQNAKYEIILYIDDDIRADSKLIYNHVKNYSNNKIGIVGGKIIEEGMGDKDKVGKFNQWTFALTTNFSSNKSQYVDHIKGCNFSVQKKVLDSIGGFDETISIGAALYEELEMGLRAKKDIKIYFDATCVLTHLVAPQGGCRINDVPGYMKGLSHNRSLVISRHLKWYYQVTAYIRLILLGLSYSRVDNSIKPLLNCIKGILVGSKAGKAPVKCGSYKCD